MSFTPGAGTRFLLFGSQPLSGGTISGNSSASFLDISGTWNTTGTPTGIKLNVTDTASNAASLLMDLRVGGVTQARITKAGSTLVSDISLWQNQTPGGSFGKVLWAGPNNTVILGRNGFEYAYVTGSGFGFSVGGTLGWGYSGSGGTADLILLRDAANTLAQRNGVNAQTFRLYNTYTDASNYERGRFAWVSNRLEIGTENAGTGTARDLRLVAGVATLNIQGSGAAAGTITPYFNRFGLANASVIFEPAQGVAWVPSFGNVYQTLTLRLFAAATGTGLRIDAGVTTTGAFLEFVEQTAPAAPAANTVRIYAEDNGSGKTRLMALFATGAAQQIAIEP